MTDNGNRKKKAGSRKRVKGGVAEVRGSRGASLPLLHLLISLNG